MMDDLVDRGPGLNLHIVTNDCLQWIESSSIVVCSSIFQFCYQMSANTIQSNDKWPGQEQNDAFKDMTDN